MNRVTLWNAAVERQIRLNGSDAEAFVIEPMRGKYCILCNASGGIVNDSVLLRLSEDEFWFSIPADPLLWLQGINIARG